MLNDIRTVAAKPIDAWVASTTIYSRRVGQCMKVNVSECALCQWHSIIIWAACCLLHA